MAEVVNGVAVEVDVAPPVQILEPDSLDAAKAGEAWTRSFLVEEGVGVASHQVGGDGTQPLGPSLTVHRLPASRSSTRPPAAALAGALPTRRGMRTDRRSKSQIRIMAALAKARRTTLFAAARPYSPEVAWL